MATGATNQEKGKVARRKARGAVSNVRNILEQQDLSVIGILCSDIHLSPKAPIARSAEPNWYAAMRRPLDEINELTNKYACDVYYAGDIFHHWNSPAELINFAIKHLPEGYAIPGQHDLPFHNKKDITKSAYWTLIESGRIKNIEWKQPHNTRDDLIVYGFPWETEFHKPSFGYKPEQFVYLALVHKYIWAKGAKHGGTVSANAHVANFVKQLRGFDSVVVGDNHIGFSFSQGNTNVINAGSLMCRNADQRNYRPQIGLLYEDGTIVPYYLDTSKDKWLDKEAIEEKVSGIIDFESLVQDYRGLGSDVLDFAEILKTAIKDPKVGKHVRTIIRELLEETSG